jgi:hypothetical protein
MNHSTNNQKVDSGTQTIVDEQFGAGSQPFVKMSFDTQVFHFFFFSSVFH